MQFIQPWFQTLANIYFAIVNDFFVCVLVHVQTLRENDNDITLSTFESTLLWIHLKIKIQSSEVLQWLMVLVHSVDTFMADAQLLLFFYNID